MYIVSAKFENVFVAPEALQQTKSGPTSKRLGTNAVGSDRRANGRPFHTKGPTTQKARFCRAEVQANGT